MIDYIRKHPQEHTQSFPYSTYFIQNIGSSYAHYTGNTLKDHNGAQHNVTGGNHMDYLVINGQHIRDYNVTYGPDALCIDLPFADPTYHDSWGNVENTRHDAWCLYSIPNYGYYLCFDYRTRKSSGEYYLGDGVYNDWVIKLNPAEGPSGGTVPTTPIVVPVLEAGLGEVEVNLSLNAPKEKDDYISSKLSIHVRDTADVDIFIPVAVNHYCEQDDMYIVLSHAQEKMW